MWWMFLSLALAGTELSSDGVVVDGVKWFDAELSKQGGGVSTWSITKDGAHVLMITKARAIGGTRMSVTLHPSQDFFEAIFDGAGPEELVAAFVRDGVLKDGAAHREAFAAYAAQRGVSLSNLQDWSRSREMWVGNRCPMPVQLVVTSAETTGTVRETTYALEAQKGGTLHALLGDRVCIAGTTTCLQVQQGLSTFGVTLGCDGFE